MLKRHDLEHLHCGSPGCNHLGEFVNARCHPNAGTECSYDANVLTVRCKKCQLLVADISITSPGPIQREGFVKPPCHQNGALDVQYVGSGQLKISCRGCHEAFAQMEVE